MLNLVFQHLLPCTFLLPSHRHHLNTADTHGRAAYKLLALVPVSCDPPATPITPRRRPSSSMTPQLSRRSPPFSCCNILSVLPCLPHRCSSCNPHNGKGMLWLAKTLRRKRG